MSFAQLNYRLPMGLLIFAGVLAAAKWLPLGGLVLILMVLVSIGMLEFYAMLDRARTPNYKIVGVLGGLLMVLATGLWGGQGRHPEILVLYAVIAAVFLRQFPQKNNPQPLETISGTLMGVLYGAFLLNFITRMLIEWPGVDGRLLVLYLVVVVKVSDVGAFFIGCSCGRHKLIPRISPAKSWEGCFGGMLFSVVGSLIFRWLAEGHWSVIRITIADAVGLGVFLAVMGIAGDLTESLFKRAAGVKDSGRIILGMGGLLDVLDSLLFAAPALYAYAQFFLK